jgi:septal ring-binding cell division protein DamX
MSSLVISKIQKNVKNFRKQAVENMLLTAIAMRMGSSYKEVCVEARNGMDTIEWDAVKSAVLKPLRAGKKLYEARVGLLDALVTGEIDNIEVLNETMKEILFRLQGNGDPVTTSGWLNYDTTTPATTTPATTTPATTTPATTTPATTTPATTTPATDAEVDSLSEKFNDELIQLIEKYADLKKSEVLEIMENAIDFFKLRTVKKVA